jgi:hypothetical protein
VSVRNIDPPTRRARIGPSSTGDALPHRACRFGRARVNTASNIDAQLLRVRPSKRGRAATRRAGERPGASLR